MMKMGEYITVLFIAILSILSIIIFILGIIEIIRLIILIIKKKQKVIKEYQSAGFLYRQSVYNSFGVFSTPRQTLTATEWKQMDSGYKNEKASSLTISRLDHMRIILEFLVFSMYLMFIIYLILQSKSITKIVILESILSLIAYFVTRILLKILFGISYDEKSIFHNLLWWKKIIGTVLCLAVIITIFITILKWI